MIKTPTAAVLCWPRCRCRPPSTATRRTASTPTPSSSPRPCSTWGCPACPTSLLGSWRPTSLSHSQPGKLFSILVSSVFSFSVFGTIRGEVLHPRLAFIVTDLKYTMRILTWSDCFPLQECPPSCRVPSLPWLHSRAPPTLSSQPRPNERERERGLTSLLTSRLLFVCFYHSVLSVTVVYHHLFLYCLLLL